MMSNIVLPVTDDMIINENNNAATCSLNEPVVNPKNGSVTVTAAHATVPLEAEGEGNYILGYN